jgi:exodeoxyribonuclease V beta subunit
MSNRLAFNVFTAELNGCNLIEASAGTGKTWSITGLYVRMVVEQELLPANILVVTFTKAATAELNGRIRQRLQQTLDFFETGQSQDEAFFAGLSQVWAKLDRAMVTQRLNRALAEFDGAAIFTIHSFCQNLLNDYAFEAQGRFNLTAITDQDAYQQQVAADFWRKYMGTLTCDDYDWIEWLLLKKQNPKKWLAAVKDHIGKPYLNALVPEPPKHDLKALAHQRAEAFTSLRATWLDEKENAKAILTEAKSKKWVNGNKFKGDIENFIDAAGAFVNTEYLDKKDNKVEKLRLSYIQENTKAGHTLPANPVFALFDAAIDADSAYQDARTACYNQRLKELQAQLLQELNLTLPKLKADNGELAFNDMLLNVYEALNRDSGELLAQAVAKRYKAALIDEFQDTDPLQLEIFDCLFRKTQTPMFYVGDPKQAIYSFRGADVHAYLSAGQKTDRQYSLSCNYRSSPRLVNSVNALFSCQQAPFIDPAIHFDAVDSKPKPTLVIDDNLAEGLNFALFKSEDAKPVAKGSITKTVAEHTAERIAQLLKLAAEGRAGFNSESGFTELKPGDFAVLVPKHMYGAEVASALMARGIPAVRQGKDKIMASDAATTLLRLLRAVAEPGKDALITELLADPLYGLNGEAILTIRDNPQNWERLLQDYFKLHLTWHEQGFSAMFSAWLAQADAQGRTMPERLMDYTDGERHLTDFLHLAEVLQQASRKLGGMQALVSWLQHALDSGDDEQSLRLESDSARVKVITMHASKGLEYKLVFCPYLWEGKGPTKDDIVMAHQDSGTVLDFGSPQIAAHRQQANKEQLMEQLRLLYVALTRSVYFCEIFWAQVDSGRDEWAYTANAALAWLLYGDTTMLADVGKGVDELLRDKVKGLSFEAFAQGIKALIEHSNRGDYKDLATQITCTAVPSPIPCTKLDIARQSTTGLALAPPLTRELHLSWWQSSFSALAGHQQAHIDEPTEHRDDQPDTLQLADADDLAAPSMFSFPRGALPGECLHSIFEHWTFNATCAEQGVALVERELNRFAIATEDDRPQWIEPVTRCVQNTLNTALQPDGFCLAQLDKQQCLDEMEFLIAAQLNLSQWRQLLCHPQHKLPELFVSACQQLDNKHVNGFITGFIDLTFVDPEGRFHILDWKSNHLGFTPADYDRPAMELAMAKSHYYLQALMYQLALHRHLQCVLPHYCPEQHLGDCWYLFVRGIDGSGPEAPDSNTSDSNTKHGVYRWKPALALILAMDSALQSAGGKA